MLNRAVALDTYLHHRVNIPSMVVATWNLIQGFTTSAPGNLIL